MSPRGAAEVVKDLLANLVAHRVADLSVDLAPDLLVNLLVNLSEDVLPHDLAAVLARTTGVNASSVEELVRRHTYKERCRMKVWA